MMIHLTNLLGLPRAEIIIKLSDVYEKSPWIVEKAFENDDVINTISSIRDLANLLKAVVDNAHIDQKLGLLKSHPDLCAEKTNVEELTEHSKKEQKKAGLLDTLSETELERFRKLSSEYKKKFGFPFILAVRNASKYTVLSAIESRVLNTPMVEMEACLGQVHKIAWMRLIQFIEPIKRGFLTCHVLDTAHGCPAANMRVCLKRVDCDDGNGTRWIKDFITNADGRLEGGPALKDMEFQVGVYEWTFFAGDYFASKSDTYIAGNPFLNEIPIRFGIDDPEDHYHVPLLCSPWSFSTYRGS